MAWESARGSYQHIHRWSRTSQIHASVAGQATVVIQECGPMMLNRADYMQNGAFPLNGSVTVDCNNLGTDAPEQHTFRGTFTFENCR